jgi:hypothetical protein
VGQPGPGRGGDAAPRSSYQSQVLIEARTHYIHWRMPMSTALPSRLRRDAAISPLLAGPGSWLWPAPAQCGRRSGAVANKLAKNRGAYGRAGLCSDFVKVAQVGDLSPVEMLVMTSAPTPSFLSPGAV